MQRSGSPVKQHLDGFTGSTAGPTRPWCVARCVPRLELTRLIGKDISVYDGKSSQRREAIRSGRTGIIRKYILIERDLPTGMANRTRQAAIEKATHLLFRHPLVAKKIEIGCNNLRTQSQGMLHQMAPWDVHIVCAAHARSFPSQAQQPRGTSNLLIAGARRIHPC